jgi:hypothetical protein
MKRSRGANPDKIGLIEWHGQPPQPTPGFWANGVGPGFPAGTTINQLIQSVAAKYFLLPLAAELCYKESN